ncbi:hypothetical protein BDQ17DRAFT_1345982 [Cyathus striatus]|nr:hypothetical protein BDQ17DRAFT_1345982 [Cyathus striatus]
MEGTNTLQRVTAPTSSLPALTLLSTYTTSHIQAALDNLQQLYWPPALPPLPQKLSIPKRRLAHLTHDDSVPDSGYASAEDDDDDEESIDSEENISVSDEDTDQEILRLDAYERNLHQMDYILHFPLCDLDRRILTDEEWEARKEQALTRTFAFPTGSSNPIKAELNDAPLSNEDHTSVGLQSWGSSILLASRTYVKTYSPTFLQVPYLSPIEVCALDWETPKYTNPLHEPFDVVLAADVIYHPEHAEWIKSCVEKVLSPTGVFWLIIPVRSTGRHEGMHCTVDKLFPVREDVKVGEGRQLVVLSREEFGRKGSVGRADEGAYKLYEIGWVE